MNIDKKEILLKHKEFDKMIQDVYDFKNIWKENCKQYNIEEQPHILPKADRVVVIGDIHGDWDLTLKSLRLAKVIDEKNENKWIGGNTIVVQVGDQIDRCRYTGIACDKKEATQDDEGNDWKILQYFTNLHKQAEEHGGAVYSLLGNHELMNVNGDMRYVSYEGYKEFDNYKDPKGETFEDGEKARRWAFKPGNPISNFLACTRQVALVIGSNIFAHAGVLPRIAKKYSVKNINELMSLYLWDKLKKKSKYNDIFKSYDYSPLWNRVFGNLKDGDYKSSNCSNLLVPLKEIYKVGKVYVGHTPQLKEGIKSVCGDKIWLTDYGASKAFDKFDTKYNRLSESESERSDSRRVQVLEIIDDKKFNILKL